MRHWIPVLVAVWLAGGCESGPAADAEADVLSQAGEETVVYATTECVAAHPDGVQCNKKTCTQDDEGDCKEFANLCIDAGHHYAGSAEGGTCSRIL